MEKDYFDIEGVEGDDELTPAPENAVTPEPEPEPEPAPAPEPTPQPLELHAKSAAAGGQYPTEDPGDDTTIWSPTPGVIGSNKQGFRKIK